MAAAHVVSPSIDGTLKLKRCGGTVMRHRSPRLFRTGRISNGGFHSKAAAQIFSDHG
jgi:hypothetical protein